MQEKYADILKTLEIKKQELSKLIEDTKEKAAIYQGYEPKTDWKPDRNLEKLEARYQA